MGAVPSRARFLTVAVLMAGTIAFAAGALGRLLFGAAVTLVPTMVTSLIVGTFAALWMIARQDREGFDVEEASPGLAETEGFDAEEVQHGDPAAPAEDDDKKRPPRQRPKGAPTRRIG